MIYHFYQKKIKIAKVKKLVGNLHNKAKYVVQVRNLKEVLNDGLVLKKINRVIKFNQNACLNLYIDMKADLKKANNDFEKCFFKLMNNADFGKSMENVRKHRKIKLVTTENRKNYLVSKRNNHTTKFFTEYLLAIEMKKLVL